LKTLLQAVLGPFDAMLGSIPLAAGRWFIVAFFAAVALATTALPREFILRGAPDRRWYRDLRLWGLAITLPYVLIYALV
jgi:hypothetical protein